MLYSEIIKHIKESSRIAILSHVLPDGDNIGSALALCNALKGIGKKAVYILDDDIPPIYRFLKGADKVEKPEILNNFDLVFVLDCSDEDRLGKSKAYLEGNKVIIIDHHISNKGFGDISIIDSEASATGELVYYLLKEMNIPLNKDISECIYTAIVTDTGQFQYSNTTEKTHVIAGELLNSGINAADMFRHIYQSYPKSKVLLIRKALESLEFFHRDMISCISLTTRQIEETGSIDSDTENLINFARDIDTVEVAVFIKEINLDKVKVSLRSKNKVDVCKIAVAFGGGGHTRAAGCTINKNVELAKKSIINAILAELEYGEK